MHSIKCGVVSLYNRDLPIVSICLFTGIKTLFVYYKDLICDATATCYKAYKLTVRQGHLLQACWGHIAHAAEAAPASGDTHVGSTSFGEDRQTDEMHAMYLSGEASSVVSGHC